MKRFFTTALSFMLVVACSTDVDIEGSNDWAKGNEVQFTASATRAYDATWESNDRVGVFASGVGVDYANCQYLVDETDSSLSAVASTEKIYIDGEGVEGDITYFAYYPFTSYAADGVYSFDLTDQSNLPNIDLLWAEPTVESDYEVELTFKHQFAELNFEISSSTGSLASVTAQLSGSYSSGSFDLQTGDFSFDGAEAISLPMIVSEDGQSATVKMLVAPLSQAELAYVKVTFTTAAGVNLSYTPSTDTVITEWVSGMDYTYKSVIID